MAVNARVGTHAQHADVARAMSVPSGTSTEGGTLDFALGIPLISANGMKGKKDDRDGEGK